MHGCKQPACPTKCNPLLLHLCDYNGHALSKKFSVLYLNNLIIAILSKGMESILILWTISCHRVYKTVYLDSKVVRDTSSDMGNPSFGGVW